MDLKKFNNKELHFLYSQQEQDRLDKLQISGGTDLEMQKLNKNGL